MMDDGDDGDPIRVHDIDEFNNSMLVRIMDDVDVGQQATNERHAKAYAAGKLAHQQGYAAGSNPHATTVDTLQTVGWMAGWMDDMNEAINAVVVPHVPGRRAVRIA